VKEKAMRGETEIEMLNVGTTGSKSFEHSEESSHTRREEGDGPQLPDLLTRPDVGAFIGKNELVTSAEAM
jgi:hypothetical protein